LEKAKEEVYLAKKELDATPVDRESTILLAEHATD